MSTLAESMGERLEVGLYEQTYLAVLVIFPQSLTLPTNAAVRTVIDALRGIVVPQLADVTVIPCRKLAAVSTLAGSGLRRLT